LGYLRGNSWRDAARAPNNDLDTDAIISVLLVVFHRYMATAGKSSSTQRVLQVSNEIIGILQPN
jgi:hypothetical protein